MKMIAISKVVTLFIAASSIHVSLALRGPAEKDRRLQAVGDIIRTVALEGGNEFQNVYSYQSMALNFMENEQQLVVNMTNERIIQRYALSCLYFATNGVSNKFTIDEMGTDITPPLWVNKQGWVSNGIDVCSWYGITCDDSSMMVTKIELPSNRMTGNVPDEIGLLSQSLQVIDFYHNDFLMGGVAPNYNAFLGQLTELREMYFAYCKFESTTGIPTEVGLLTNLVAFDSGFNLFSGNLRGSTFWPLQSLVYLDISGGNYNSPVIDEIAYLPNLEEFYIVDSFVTGDVSYLSKMTKLVQHQADYNPSLGGSIPDASLLSSDLIQLSFSQCGLTGTIPASLGTLTNMEKLFFDDNNLSSSIPTELGMLSLLSDLEIEENNIIGTMPTEICDNLFIDGLIGGQIKNLISDCETNGSVECSCCTACGRQSSTE